MSGHSAQDYNKNVAKVMGPKVAPTIVEYPEMIHYVTSHNAPISDAQKGLREEVQAHPRGGFAASLEESIFLAFLCKTMGAKKVIEVGVFLGVTTLAIAEVLPENGKIVALDVDAEYTSVGEKYWKQAGVDKKVDLRIAAAVETLKNLSDDPNEVGTFDFSFIDADKENYDAYYEYSLKLLRVGGIIAVDNVFFHGKILGDNLAPGPKAIKELNEKMQKDKRVEISITTMADGLTLVRKL